MYLKFLFNNDSLPKEFGEDIKNCVYYSSEKKLSSDIIEEREKFLGRFGQINLFVGTNNSGKSRFLRGLLRTDSLFFEIFSDTSDLDDLHANIENWHNLNFSKIRNLDMPIYHEVHKIYSELGKIKDPYYHQVTNFHSYGRRYENLIKDKESDYKRLQDSNLNEAQVTALEKKIELVEHIEKIYNELNFATTNQPADKIYLPILRSIKTSKTLPKDIFVRTTKDLYDLPNSNIFTGLDLFDKVRNLRNDRKKIREGFEEFEEFISRHFFQEDNRVEIISHLGEETILLLVNDEERKIHDIGDGVQSIILLLFPIYTAKSNSWIFIEEPELNLHPGLQRIFINTLIGDEYLASKNLRYFFTTHSNHFLDKSLFEDDISIFQFQKLNPHHFNIKADIQPNREILDLLGVNNSSVFLANSSIWVEGPTDRKYISKLLRLYAKENNLSPLREDIDFAFFEYGGNLIKHYLFDELDPSIDQTLVREYINSFSLSNKIFLLADNDNTEEGTKKGKLREKLKDLSSKQVNFSYRDTVFTEIENLLPQKVVRDFMFEIVQKEAFDKLKKIDFERSEYERIKLGNFYSDLFKKKKIPKKSQKSYRSETGTLSNRYKLKLCQFFVDRDMEYHEAIKDNEQIDLLIKELYEFIKECQITLAQASK